MQKIMGVIKTSILPLNSLSQMGYFQPKILYFCQSCQINALKQINTLIN